jgi:hypothetical protein
VLGKIAILILTVLFGLAGRTINRRPKLWKCHRFIYVNNRENRFGNYFSNLISKILQICNVTSDCLFLEGTRRLRIVVWFVQKTSPIKLQILTKIIFFQFSFTDFPLVIAPPSRRYFQGHSPWQNPRPLTLM